MATKYLWCADTHNSRHRHYFIFAHVGRASVLSNGLRKTHHFTGYLWSVKSCRHIYYSFRETEHPALVALCKPTQTWMTNTHTTYLCVRKRRRQEKVTYVPGLFLFQMSCRCEIKQQSHSHTRCKCYVLLNGFSENSEHFMSTLVGYVSELLLQQS